MFHNLGLDFFKYHMKEPKQQTALLESESKENLLDRSGPKNV